MNIGIIVYTGANPFRDYPQLRSIWPEPYRSLAEGAVVEHLDLLPEVDIGDIVLIMKNDVVVGISGYFPFNEEYTDFGLRWHGVIPEFRGQGISRAALSQVAALALRRFPEGDHLIELVPLNAYGDGLVEYFQRIGFRPHGETERYDWADHDWQPHRIKLSELAENPAPAQNIARP